MTTPIFIKELLNYSYQVCTTRPIFDFQEVNQVHGNTVVTSTGDDPTVEADGIIYDNGPICVKTADCLPIVIIGNGAAIVHAGWRGIQNNIITDEKIKALGPKLFFIGPHIKSCCYEISEEFKNIFPSSNSFIVRENKTYFDLAKEIEIQINKHYPQATIDFSSICTCCNNDFHSFRRDKTPQRNYNILRLQHV